MLGMAQVSSRGLAFNCLGSFVVATLVYRYPLVVAKNPWLQHKVNYIRVGVAVLLALGGLGALVELIARNV